MKGFIDLKDFIFGVKKELVKSSKEVTDKPFFELTEVEMEAEFTLKAGAKVDGGFKFLVKVSGEAKGAQSHKVLLKFKPLPADYLQADMSKYDLGIFSKITDRSQPKPPFVTIPEIPGTPRGPVFQPISIFEHQLELFKSLGIISDYSLNPNPFKKK